MRSRAHSCWTHWVSLLLRHRRLTAAFLVISFLAWPIASLTAPSVAKAGVNSWTPVTLPNNMNVTVVSLSPAFPCDKTVFVGTDGFGVYRTTQGDDDDAIWYPVNGGITDLSITSLAVSPNYNRCDRAAQFNQGDRTLIAGTRTGRVYISTNGGASWTPSNGGLPDITNPHGYSIGAVAISPNFASDRIMIVSLQAVSANGASGVFRTTNGGTSWLGFDAGLADRNVQAFAMSANFANDATLFVGTRFSGVYRFAGRLTESDAAAPVASPVASPAATPSATPASGGVFSTRGSDNPAAGAAATLLESKTQPVERLQATLYPYPSIQLIATGSGAQDGQTAYSVPGPVVFEYTVVNNGNETISNIRIIDAGKQSFCGDDPDTDKVDESKDDTLVGAIASLGPGQQATVTATFLVRPASEAGSGSTDTTFVPRRYAACAIGDSVSRGPVISQDDAVVQLVVWTSITKTNSSMNGLWVWSFAVSPFFANDQTIYVGSAYGGLFKSTNAGSSKPSWVQVNNGLEPDWVSVRAIALSPRYPSDKTVYAGTEAGIFKGVEQVDGSVAWSRLNQGLQSTDVRALGISPNYSQDNVLYAGVWGGDIYKQLKGNPVSWAPQRRILNGLWSWSTAVTLDGVLFNGAWSTGPAWPQILGRNVLNGSAGWEFPTLPATAGGEATTVVVSSSYCTGYEVFLGTWDRGLFKSTDAGATWTKLAIPTNVPIRVVALSPNYAFDRTVYVGTWGNGIFRSFDGGESWASLNVGLGDPLVRSIVIPSSYPQDGLVVAGTDNAGVFRWDAQRGRWSGASNGLPNSRVMGLTASQNFNSDKTIFAATWGGGVAISTNRGDSWAVTGAGLGSPYVRTVAVSPNYPSDRVLYAGTNLGPYRSGNNATSWRYMGTTGDELTKTDVTNFAVTPNSPRTVFVSTGGKGLWAYTESGALSGIAAGVQRLASHLGPNLPFHAFMPMAPKNRLGGVC